MGGAAASRSPSFATLLSDRYEVRMSGGASQLTIDIV